MEKQVDPNSDLKKKGTMDTFFGPINLNSLRNDLNPAFSFNVHTIVLLVAGFVLIILTGSTVNYPGVDLFFLLFAIDSLIASLLVMPVYYYKGGYTILKEKDFNQMITNTDISPDEIKNYMKFLIPRLIIYVILIQTSFGVFERTNFNAIAAYTYIFWAIIVGILGIIFIVNIITAGLGLLIDDYLNEGTSHKAWKDFRSEVSNFALELDGIISRINNSQNTVVNQQYRQKMAGALFKLRNYLVIEEHPDSSFTPEMKIKFVKAEQELSQELLENLKKDKCVVCYSQLENSTGPFSVCPICGQGGHKDHIEEWFKTKTNCPGCTSDLSSTGFLTLS